MDIPRGADCRGILGAGAYSLVKLKNEETNVQPRQRIFSSKAAVSLSLSLSLSLVAPFFVLPCADMAATWLSRPVSCCRGIHVAASSAR